MEEERERERDASRVGIRNVWKGSSMKFIKTD